jgi:hypothetical protein
VAKSSTPGEQSSGVFRIGHQTGARLREMHQILDVTAPTRPNHENNTAPQMLSVGADR